MGKCAEWIEDALGAVKASGNSEAIKVIESCGKGCAARKDAENGILQLKASASSCRTMADYADFLRKTMPVRIEEAEDGIILHLGKTSCSCPMAAELTKNTDILCECTKGHEKAVWSAFFGKPVEIEIVESFLRGGNDCVIKILV